MDDLLPLALPTLMFTFGNSNLWNVLKMWAFIVFLANFCMGFVSVNAGHHHNTIFHDGDTLKSLDFGVYQLAATIDRNDIKSSLFLTLTNFGHHILHHFFPTLDHAVLPQLQEIFVETCREFENDFRELPWWELIKGQFKQLTRTEPIEIK
jgi:fatty acid desaturase